MSETTTIEWTDATLSPWYGCTKVGPGCDHCYAEGISDKRFHIVKWGTGQPRKRNENFRANAMKLERKAIREGRQIKVFPSMCDPFDNEVPDEWRADMFATIRATPHLTWLLLTKRIGNASRMVAHAIISQADPIAEGAAWPWPNVWLGATVVNQEEADRDIPKLLAVPAAKRFLSIEPMLGPINLATMVHENGYGSSPCTGCGATVMHNALDGTTYCAEGCDGPLLNSIDWVIAGGESGPHARPAHPDWFRSLRDQCAPAGVPFLFKQWGEFSYDYDRDRDDPDWRKCNEWDHKPGRWLNLAGGHGFNGERVHYAHKVGTKAAGNHLDGRQHLGFPQP